MNADIRHNIASPAISVVMPAYNAEKYIAESINSILAQDFEDFELIIVDDCSTDGTSLVVSSFCDERVKLFQTDKNTGSAKYPREMAIEHAKAPYICWIDSDDTVDSNYLSSLLSVKKATQANIVCSQMLAEKNGQVVYLLPENGFDYDIVVSGREALIMTLAFPWRINLNGWLCDKELWLEISSFKSLVINHMDADDFSAREILFNASKVAFSSVCYHYRLHTEAITKKITKKKFESVITDRLVLDFLSKNLPEAVPVMQRTVCQRMISLMRLYVLHKADMPESECQGTETLLNEYYSKIAFIDLTKTNLSLKHKILLCLPFRLSKYLINRLN